MPPEKKQKVIVSDLDWCINNSDTLDIETFSEVFNYGNKSSANHRYVQILKTKRFNSCVSNAEQFLSDFNIWKRSQQETTFWENRKVELARKSTESELRVAANGALRRVVIQEGDRVASNCEPSQTHAPEPMNDSSDIHEIMSDSEPSSSRSSVNSVQNKR